MDYIIDKMNRRINFLETADKKNELRVHYQARLEYILINLLALLWNKNFEKLQPDDKEYVLSAILRPSVGTLVDISRKLDLDKEIYGNNSVKKVQQVLDKYPMIRNEKIGHGYVYEDSTDEYTSDLRLMYEHVLESNLIYVTNEIDLIQVITLENNVYKGIAYKADGITYMPWSCPEETCPFSINAIYACYNHNNYFCLSPFVVIENEDEFYTFSSVQEKLTGRCKFNRLIKTGIKTYDVPEFLCATVESNSYKRRTANGTIRNIYLNNFKKYIDIGIKKRILDFLLKNKSSVFATIWGHGGVGKTAAIQSVCEDLCNDTKIHFDYIIFVTAKDRYYNYYKGTIQKIDESVDSLEGIVQYMNKVVFDESSNDLIRISEYDGLLLLVIDDFETFSPDEKVKIISFISSLNVNHHKVVITTRSAYLVTGLEIESNELSEEEASAFLIEVLKIEVPNLNIEKIEAELKAPDCKARIHEITSGRPIFIFQLAILLAQKGSLKSTIDFDVKSSSEAIKFLYDRIYEYLSADAKIIFVTLSLLVTEDDLSNVTEKLKFILNKENKEDEFNKALAELVKLRIIELVDNDFFRVYSKEILKLMRYYYQKEERVDDGSITSRLSLVGSEKKLNNEHALLQNADSSRISQKEEVVVNKYRYILNRQQTPVEIKRQALLNLATYLFDTKGKVEQTIKLFKDYNHLFYRDAEMQMMYSKYSWASGIEEYREFAVNILTSLLFSKASIGPDQHLEILGSLVMYRTILAVMSRDQLKETYRYGEIPHSEYLVLFTAQKKTFQSIFNHNGMKLYSAAKKHDLATMNPATRNVVLIGLVQFIEICIRLVKLDLAKEICDFVITTLPYNYHAPFKTKLSKIDAINSKQKTPSTGIKAMPRVAEDISFNPVFTQLVVKKLQEPSGDVVD